MIRAALSLVAAALLTLGFLGLLTRDALQDPTEFAVRMGESLQDPVVNAEVKGAVRDQAAAAVRSAGAAGGLLGTLAAGLAAEAVADRLAGAVDSDAFAEAYVEWAQLLHAGLADYALGETSDTVSVSGNTVSVAVGPLIEPLVGQDAAATAQGALRAVGADAVLSVDAGVDLRVLRGLGTIASLAPWLLGAAAAALVAVFAVGPDRLRWLGAALLVCAATSAALAAWLWWVRVAPLPESDYPAVGRSVVAALTSGWAAAAAALAACLGLPGAALIAVAGRRRRHRRVGAAAAQ